MISKRYITPMKLGTTKKIIAILLVIQVSILFAGVYLSSFEVRSDGSNVVLTWQTQSETNLSHFVVERKPSNSDQFIELAYIQPEPDKDYEYIDQSAYKAMDSYYVYRLKIVDFNGTHSFSREESVYHQVSGVKRTWGSIKALFR